jgi:Dolichyl-phosphate-mannose-protein mannosyltransferase
MIHPPVELGGGVRRRTSEWPARARSAVAGRGELVVGLGALAVALAGLLARLAPDVGSRPLNIDEAVTGLVSARPLPELLGTVLAERGGPPLHFLAVHAALLVDPSVQAQRWVSIAFALGAVVLCYDLGRRVGGHVAGATAALVAATSMTLGELGTFGRMYAAFAFTAALAADTFYRALERRTTRASALAAFAAVLVAATHTYGVFLLLAEASAALVLWRGRPVRAALPVVLVGLLLIPVLLGYLRLSQRFSVGVGEGSSLATPGGVGSRLHATLAGFSGGRQLVVVFAVLALLGVVVVIRRQPAFLALWAAVAAPLALNLLLSGSGAVALSSRHLIYALPLWAVLVGAGFARLTGRLPLAARALILAVLAAIAVEFHPAEAGDPRGAGPFGRSTANTQALAAPSSWVRQHVLATDVLYQYSPVFLAALDTTRRATTVGPGPGRLLREGLGRVHYPVSAVVTAIPVAGADLDEDALRARLGRDAQLEATRKWLVVRMAGPFDGERELLLALAEAFAAARDSMRLVPETVDLRLEGPFLAVCGALAQDGRSPPACAGAAPSGV